MLDLCVLLFHNDVLMSMHQMVPSFELASRRERFHTYPSAGSPMNGLRHALYNNTRGHGLCPMHYHIGFTKQHEGIAQARKEPNEDTCGHLQDGKPWHFSQATISNVLIPINPQFVKGVLSRENCVASRRP